MKAVSEYGPFRTAVREVPGPDRTAVCVRIDRVNEDGEWITQALYDVQDLWFLLPALQAAQAEAIATSAQPTTSQQMTSAIRLVSSCQEKRGGSIK